MTAAHDAQPADMKDLVKRGAITTALSVAAACAADCGDVLLDARDNGPGSVDGGGTGHEDDDPQTGEPKVTGSVVINWLSGVGVQSRPQSLAVGDLEVRVAPL